MCNFPLFLQSVAHCILFTAKLGPMGFYKVTIVRREEALVRMP